MTRAHGHKHTDTPTKLTLTFKEICYIFLRNKRNPQLNLKGAMNQPKTTQSITYNPTHVENFLSKSTEVSSASHSSSYLLAG